MLDRMKSWIVRGFFSIKLRLLLAGTSLSMDDLLEIITDLFAMSLLSGL